MEECANPRSIAAFLKTNYGIKSSSTSAHQNNESIHINMHNYLEFILRKNAILLTKNFLKSPRLLRVVNRLDRFQRNTMSSIFN
jgi:hypothetical protein